MPSKDTSAAISLLGENDVHIGITTNGSFIDRFIEPISEYSKWTRVSMDAATDGMFTIVRPTKGGKSKFQKIVDNMRMLAKTKNVGCLSSLKLNCKIKSEI